MILTIEQIDLVDLLGLDRILGGGEVDEVVENLNKEIWYRILHEELPKSIEPAKFTALIKKFETEADLEKVTRTIEKEYPEVKLEGLVKQSTNAVKREFITNYLENLLVKFPDDSNAQTTLNELIQEINKAEISSEKLERLKLSVYRLATTSL